MSAARFQRLAAVITCAALLLLALLAGGCALPSFALSDASATAAPVAGQWGFPFRAGTQVKLGDFGLHDDNYHGLSDYSLSNAALATSALDIVPVDQSAPTEVIPLAAGQILAWAPACHFLLVDHYNGVWVGYQHLDLSPDLHVGSVVNRNTTLGDTADAPINAPNCEYSTARHVHIAFISGSGNTGAFVSMVGQSLCGHIVTTSSPTQSAPHGGAISGLANAPGATFAVPDCADGSGSATATATAPTASPTGSPASACATISGFASADAASPLATHFVNPAGSGAPVVPAPPESVGYVLKAFDDPAVGEPGMVYHFELINVCSPAITADGVRVAFAREMVNPGGWFQSDTFPYGGKFDSACGDPYCWEWGPTGGDISEFASLEKVTQIGAVTVYQLRLGVERPQ